MNGGPEATATPVRRDPIRLLFVAAGVLLIAVAAVASTRHVVRTEQTGPPVQTATFSCGSAVAPRHYSEARARRILGFKPAVISARAAVNGECDFDIRGRRIRSGLVTAAGVVLAAVGVWPPRRRLWMAPATALAAALLLFGVPRLFGSG